MDRVHGVLAILAAGTHPTALWRAAQQTDSDRYDAVMDDLQMIGQRNMLCGLHVHVELPDPDDRVDIMMRMLPYLPLFIALATSSPFWRARPTGLKGYRLAAYDELPRSGVPELFRTREEFDAELKESAVKSVKVQLPKALPSRLTTLQKACPEATYAANTFACPASSKSAASSTA